MPGDTATSAVPADLRDQAATLLAGLLGDQAQDAVDAGAALLESGDPAGVQVGAALAGGGGALPLPVTHPGRLVPSPPARHALEGAGLDVGGVGQVVQPVLAHGPGLVPALEVDGAGDGLQVSQVDAMPMPTASGSHVVQIPPGRNGAPGRQPERPVSYAGAADRAGGLAVPVLVQRPGPQMTPGGGIDGEASQVIDGDGRSGAAGGQQAPVMPLTQPPPQPAADMIIFRGGASHPATLPVPTVGAAKGDGHGGGGNAETLRRYWGTGEGSLRIRWGTPGDHMRCVDQLMEHGHFTEEQAHGYCNLLEKRVTGLYPAQHAHLEKTGHAAAWDPRAAMLRPGDVAGLDLDVMAFRFRHGWIKIGGDTGGRAKRVPLIPEGGEGVPLAPGRRKVADLTYRPAKPVPPLRHPLIPTGLSTDEPRHEVTRPGGAKPGQPGKERQGRLSRLLLGPSGGRPIFTDSRGGIAGRGGLGAHAQNLLGRLERTSDRGDQIVPMAAGERRAARLALRASGDPDAKALAGRIHTGQADVPLSAYERGLLHDSLHKALTGHGRIRHPHKNWAIVNNPKMAGARVAAQWDAALHPRGPGGQFGTGTGAPAGGTPTNQNPVGNGEEGDRVRQLQERLNQLGFHLAVDGQFGPKTLAAVRAYQTARGLKVDGLVGPKTTAALRIAKQPGVSGVGTTGGATTRKIGTAKTRKTSTGGGTRTAAPAPAKSTTRTSRAAKPKPAPARPAPARTPATPRTGTARTPASKPLPASAAGKANMAAGSHGPAVTLAQRKLAAAGAKLPATGTYDVKTTAAVRAFQRTHHDAAGKPLKVDGILGPKTWAALSFATAKGAHGRAVPRTAGVHGAGWDETKHPRLPGGGRGGGEFSRIPGLGGREKARQAHPEIAALHPKEASAYWADRGAGVSHGEAMRRVRADRGVRQQQITQAKQIIARMNTRPGYAPSAVEHAALVNAHDSARDYGHPDTGKLGQGVLTSRERRGDRGVTPGRLSPMNENYPGWGKSEMRRRGEGPGQAPGDAGPGVPSFRSPPGSPATEREKSGPGGPGVRQIPPRPAGPEQGWNPPGHDEAGYVPAGKVRKGDYLLLGPADTVHKVTGRRKARGDPANMVTIDVQRREDIGVRHRSLPALHKDLTHLTVLRPGTRRVRSAHASAGVIAFAFRHGWIPVTNDPVGPAGRLHKHRVAAITRGGKHVTGTYDHGRGQVVDTAGARHAVTHIADLAPPRTPAPADLADLARRWAAAEDLDDPDVLAGAVSELRDWHGRWATGGGGGGKQGALGLGGRHKKAAVKVLRASHQPGSSDLARKIGKTAGPAVLTPAEHHLLGKVLSDPGLHLTGGHLSKGEGGALAQMFGQPGKKGRKAGRPRPLAHEAYGPFGRHVTRREARGFAQMFAADGEPEGGDGAAGVTVPALVTIPGVDLLAAGTWHLSTGRQTFTRDDLEHAADAAKCPAVGPPVIKIGHLDPRFAPKAGQDGEPAIGQVRNLRLNDAGTKLTGDLTGMPGWLGAVASSAFPRRSVEGKFRFRCQIGHQHDFVVTALALLGVTPPGVGVLSGLPDIAGLYGVTPSTTAAAAPADTWRTEPTDTQGAVMAVTEEDVRRAYYASAGAPNTWWITELQMNPPQLIVADEDSGKLYRVPYSIEGSAVSFDAAAEIASYSEVAAARGTGPVIVYASAEESRTLPEPGEVEAAWDAGQAQKNLGDDPSSGAIKAMYALPGENKTASSLPHHDVGPDGKVGAPNEQACVTAIAAINGARGGLKGRSPAELKAAHSHLASHLRDMNHEPPAFNAAGEDAPGPGDLAARLDRLYGVLAAAQGDSDADDDVKSLVASLDATLDQASQLSAGIDRSTLDADAGQALDLIVAAEAIADQLMDKLGIYDPDDAGGDGGDGGTSAAADDGAEGDDVAAGPVGPKHGNYTGSHSHPHFAKGSQGGDETHEHVHAHDGDDSHDHAHDTQAAAAASTESGGVLDMGFEFTSTEMAAIRRRLGKTHGEPITAADIAAAMDTPKAPTIAATAGGAEDDEVKVPVLADGTYLVDSEVLTGYQQRAVAGDRAVMAMHLAERDTILAAAVDRGKFSQARREHFERLWDKDPEGTRKLVASLAPGLVPMGGPLGSSGDFTGDPDVPGDYEAQQAYFNLYPEDRKGGVSPAPGVRGRLG